MVYAGAVLKKANIPAATAYEDEANLFIQPQKVKNAGQVLATLYRVGAETNGQLSSLDFSLDNLAHVEKVYAQVSGVIEDSTTSSEKGQVILRVLHTGQLRNALQILNDGSIIWGTPTTPRAKFSAAGLTALRTFTFPDFDAKLASADDTNVFVAQQTIETPSGTFPQLILRRLSSTIGNGAGISYQLQDAGGNTTTYAQIYGAITNNVEGSEAGEILASVLYGVSPSLQTVMRIRNTGLFEIGTPGNRFLRLADTGLTTARTFTFPDVTTKLAGLLANNIYTQRQEIDNCLDLIEMANPTALGGQIHSLFISSTSKHLSRISPAGVVTDLETNQVGQGGPPPPPGGGGGPTSSYIYDNFPSTYNLTTNEQVSTNNLWRLKRRGANPGNGSDVGQVGVRVPSVLPPDSSPRVFYAYPYTGAYTGTGTSDSVTVTEVAYFQDFDITLYIRTIAQRKTTNVEDWEMARIAFHFNEANGTYYHNYFLTLKTNGLELSRLDNTISDPNAIRILADNNDTHPLGTWYKVRIRAVGNQFTIFVNDVQKFDVIDNGTLVDGLGTIPAPSVEMYSGRFALIAQDCEAEWAPMTVSPLTVAPTYGGEVVLSGNATLKDFNIPHGLTVKPSIYNVELGSEDAMGNNYKTADATNIIVHYAIAPPTGTNNLTFIWSASV